MAKVELRACVKSGTGIPHGPRRKPHGPLARASLAGLAGMPMPQQNGFSHTL